jgi:hypothetical protein
MTTYRATLALELEDPDLLRAYTSGFMSKVTDQERLLFLLQQNHPLRSVTNGVQVIGVMVEEV